ncbi:unnamed protein product [Taenia asiatica]|uniref:Uncharacterized protein n=1 Tax=Taenia asiatica TaxID=60517 RepID=A0A0R3WER2_TAEAS|nr:unnamed protein product [Taenia asiatica]
MGISHATVASATARDSLPRYRQTLQDVAHPPCEDAFSRHNGSFKELTKPVFHISLTTLELESRGETFQGADTIASLIKAAEVSVSCPPMVTSLLSRLMATSSFHVTLV